MHFIVSLVGLISKCIWIGKGDKKMKILKLLDDYYGAIWIPFIVVCVSGLIWQNLVVR